MSTKLDRLHKRLSTLQQEVSDLDAQIKSHKDSIKASESWKVELLKEIKQVKTSIQEHKTQLIDDMVDTKRVTDHATIRYMERVLGIDVDKFKSDLISPLVPLIKQCPNGTIKTEFGTVQVVDGKIVTII